MVDFKPQLDDPRREREKKKTAKTGYSLWLHRWRCEVTMLMSESETC